MTLLATMPCPTVLEPPVPLGYKAGPPRPGHPRASVGPSANVLGTSTRRHGLLGTASPSAAWDGDRPPPRWLQGRTELVPQCRGYRGHGMAGVPRPGVGSPRHLRLPGPPAPVPSPASVLSALRPSQEAPGSGRALVGQEGPHSSHLSAFFPLT